MNCPKCYEGIGRDQYRYSDWRMTDRDGVLYVVRTLYLECDFCGTFEVTERCSPRQFDSIHHPRNAKDTHRIRRKLPCRGAA